MKKEDIIVLPNPNLRKKSKVVASINDNILQIINNMIQATINWDESREHEVGVALAAIQIDQPYKIIVVRNDLDNKEDLTFKAFINPKIVKLYGDIIEDYEGCLSVPDIYGKVPRYNKVRIEAIGIDGKDLNITATGFLAKIFQHEIDHTEGILFIDKIREANEAFFKLNSKGKLEKLDFVKDVEKNNILW